MAAAVTISMLAVSACSPSPESRAKTLDMRYGTGIFSWLVAHEPSAVDVAGTDAANVARLDPRATVSAAVPSFRRACAVTKARHAVLFIIPPKEARERARSVSNALDCGYAIARDEGGLVIAPR